jgi:hypothetical protein
MASTIYWRRCAAHLTANLLKNAVATEPLLAALMVTVDSVIAYHRATPTRKTALLEYARLANIEEPRPLITVCRNLISVCDRFLCSIATLDSRHVSRPSHV